MINEIAIAFQKRRLRKRYTAYRKLLDNFSCGAALAEVISLRVSDAKNEVNETIRELVRLDPKCKLKEME